MNEVTFTAYLAGVNSSAKPLARNRDGSGKLVLEYSASDRKAIDQLWDFPQDVVFRFTVVPISGNGEIG